MCESEDWGRIWLRRSGGESSVEVLAESERESKGIPKPDEGESSPEERESAPIWEGGPSLRAFYPFYLVGSLALACTTVAALALPLPLWAIGALVPLSLFIIALPFALQPAWTFTLTERAARSRFRLWVGKSKSAPLDKVTDTSVEQGPLARLLGFGSVRIDTAGTPFPGVKFWGVEEPFRLRDMIERVVDENKDREE